MAYKHHKLIVNLGNATEIICPAGEGATLVTKMTEEAQQVLAAAGLLLPGPDAVTAVPEPVDPAVPRVGGSTRQSVVRNARSVETDYLNGEIVLLGRLNGVDAPANATAQEYARKVADGRIAPNSVPEADLLAQVG
jgi:2-dehydropantoate 2-reductase